MTTQNSFSFTPSKIIMLLSVLAAILVMVFIVIFGINPNKPTEGEAGSTVYPPTLSALATGCGDYFLWDTAPATHYAYLTQDELETTKFFQPPMNLPAYGYMSEQPMAEGDTNAFLTPQDLDNTAIPFPTVLRTLFDYNVTIIWYDPNNTAIILDVKDYVSQHKDVMAMPWLYTDRQIPLNRGVAFSHWGITQSCSSFSESMANDFVTFTAQHPIQHDITPPHAVITNGTAPMLNIGKYTVTEYLGKLSGQGITTGLIGGN